jgi:predicted nucleic acid-binding protein/virulence-associated protein VagC
MDTAKLFWTGRSQAVRLPKRFRFEGGEVRIRRRGDAVILEPIAADWAWLDAFAGRLDEDVVRGAEERSGRKTVRRWMRCSAEGAPARHRRGDRGAEGCGFADRPAGTAASARGRPRLGDRAARAVLRGVQERAGERNVALVDGLRFGVLEFDRDDAREAGEVRAFLARRGTPIGPYDVLIAGQAKARGMVLVTHNTGEFSRVPGLRIEDWEVD